MVDVWVIWSQNVYVKLITIGCVLTKPKRIVKNLINNNKNVCSAWEHFPDPKMDDDEVSEVTKQNHNDNDSAHTWKVNAYAGFLTPRGCIPLTFEDTPGYALLTPQLAFL